MRLIRLPARLVLPRHWHRRWRAQSAARASLDLGFADLRATLGVSVLLALAGRRVVGGLVLAASVVLPMQQRLRARAVPRRTSARQAEDR